MNNGIILDARRIKAFEGFYALGEYAAREEDWLNSLWEMLLESEDLMDEFMYYLDHHSFKDALSCRGYSLTDLYVFQMTRYNLIRDSGKNTHSCNKESMVLGAFYDMAQMQKDPDSYEKKLKDSPGSDRL